MIDTGPEQIVVRFQRRHDERNWSEVARLLSRDCEFFFGASSSIGADSIVKELIAESQHYDKVSRDLGVPEISSRSEAEYWVTYHLTTICTVSLTANRHVPFIVAYQRIEDQLKFDGHWMISKRIYRESQQLPKPW